MFSTTENFRLQILGHPNNFVHYFAAKVNEHLRAIKQICRFRANLSLLLLLFSAALAPFYNKTALFVTKELCLFFIFIVRILLMIHSHRQQMV